MNCDLLKEQIRIKVAAEDRALDYARQIDAQREAIRLLRAALTEIAEASNFPDNNEWYDEYGDMVDVDASNQGDVHGHGYSLGEWAAAKIARKALA